MSTTHGPQPVVPLEELSWQDHLDQLLFFVKSPTLLGQAVLPAMKERGRGRIVQIGSDIFERAVPGMSAYVAAKGAQLGLTRSWARELGPFGIIFRELHDEDCLRGLRRDMFVGRLAYYLGEVNALHPFREGNGRAQRAFFAQLARDAGFTLAWQHLDPVRNVEASAAIMRGDPEPMRKMLEALVRDGT